MSAENNSCRRRSVRSAHSVSSESFIKVKSSASSESIQEQKADFPRSFLPGEFVHGKISFSNVYTERDKYLPYVHFSYDANIEMALNEMMLKWKLSVPRIILVLVSNISPLTGWKNLEQLENFTKGMIKAVNTTEMWICTHGINIGITKVISDAFNDELIRRQNLYCERHPAHAMTFPQTNLLGICREDLLSYADKLDGNGCVISVKNEGNCPEENKFDLNPYHSHLIVVQDNTVRKAEINSFLLKFEKYLSSQRSQEKGEATNLLGEVPVVAVLVQGGVSCAQLILSHLQQQLPVVAIKGSGGLADLLAYAYYEVNRRPQRRNDAEYIETILKPALTIKISHAFPYLRYNQLSRNLLCKNILECIQCSIQGKTQYLMILNTEDQNCNFEELPVHLLRALFKSQKTDTENWKQQMQKELLLTVDWNSPEVALTEVFQKDSSRNLEIDKKIFESALLKTGREEFVSLFLDQGFQVHKYLDAVTLGRLFHSSLKMEFFYTVCWENILGHRQVMDISRQFIDVDLNWLITELTDIPSLICSHQLDYNASGSYMHHCKRRGNHKYGLKSAELRAITILILWAILSNRGILAKTLWKHSDQPMNTALLCSLMLQKLQPYIHDSIREKEVKQLSVDFAEMATGVLDACYNDMPCRAYEALQEKHPAWENHSSLEIATLSKNMTFVSHVCCQKYLNNMFMGHVRIRDMTWGIFPVPEFLKILLSAFLIFPMYIWVRFKVGVHGEEIKDFGDNEVEDQEDLPEELIVQSKGSHTSISSHISGMTEAVNLPIKAKVVYPPLRLMILWMWSAPITKFWITQVFYMLFLALFSLDVLWPSCGNISLDVATFTWGLLILLGEIRRALILHKKYVSMPLFLRCVEIMYVIIFLVFFLTGRILRYGFFSDPYMGKVLLCLGLLYMYYRMMFIYLPISSTLGPLLSRTKRLMLSVIFRRMLRYHSMLTNVKLITAALVQAVVWFDFMNFMRMTLLLLISNGIVLQASIYPDFPITPELFRQTFHRAWIAFFLTPVSDFIYQSTYLRKMDSATSFQVDISKLPSGDGAPRYPAFSPFLQKQSSKKHLLMKLLGPLPFTAQFVWGLLQLLHAATWPKCTPWFRKPVNATFCKAGAYMDYSCPNPGFWPYVFGIQFLVILKIILMTLLYAWFSNTHSLLQNSSVALWKFQRYQLVADFSHRTKLPPPLNAISFLLEILKPFRKMCQHCRKEAHAKVQPEPGSDSKTPSSFSDYSYWKHLAQEYIRNLEEKGKEEEIIRKQTDIISSLTEDINHQRKVLHKIKSQVVEVAFDVSYVHTYLETITYRSAKDEVTGQTATVQVLSRRSPYPKTKIQRYPVPNKYVAWEVLLLSYNPPTYSMRQLNFIAGLQPFVDKDVTGLGKDDETESALPVFRWNMDVVNSDGIYENRQSWITDSCGKPITYKLDLEGLPQNPMGRTGLKGRGACPRWGPNHYIYIIVTRWKDSPDIAEDQLEFIEMWIKRRNDLSLPGGFIKEEKYYSTIRELFKNHPNHKSWEASNDMIDFFRSCVMPPSSTVMASDSAYPEHLHYQMVMRGYMDSPSNTDQAWKEVELWHFHFEAPDIMKEKMKNKMAWRLIAEEVFSQLPPGQAVLLQNTINTMKATVK